MKYCLAYKPDTVDPECDIAVVTMAQLLLQQGKVIEALKYFERAAELSRTEGEIANALEYAEATRTQLEVSKDLTFLLLLLPCSLFWWLSHHAR